MTNIAELRREAIRARDEHGNTDFYMILNSAADIIEDLCKQIDGCVKVAADALKRVKELEDGQRS
jgi:hypothetical protein